MTPIRRGALNTKLEATAGEALASPRQEPLQRAPLMPLHEQRCLRARQRSPPTPGRVQSRARAASSPADLRSARRRWWWPPAAAPAGAPARAGRRWRSGPTPRPCCCCSVASAASCAPSLWRASVAARPAAAQHGQRGGRDTERRSGQVAKICAGCAQLSEVASPAVGGGCAGHTRTRPNVLPPQTQRG